MAWDGTTVKAPASGGNVACFGRPRGKKDGHYPQLRLVTLVACGTRALLARPSARCAAGAPANRRWPRGLLGSLHAGMLLLADRNFYGYQLWNAAAGTGADLLWRVKASLHLPVVRPLPDGSWLSVIPDPAAVRRRTARNGKRRRRGSTLPPDTSPLPGITVRVIEFWLTITAGDGAVRTERYRLITTLADHRASPAAALAAGYAQRWAIETGFREFKTYLRGPGRILRGRTPELARQELWAYLTLYQAIRAVICLAAASARIDPDRISFTATLHAIRRTATRPHQPGRRPGRNRSRHPHRTGPPPRGPRLRPGGQPAVLAVPVQAQHQRPDSTARPVHRHHHHTRPPAHTTTEQAKQPIQHPGNPP